jgi:uncharacterized protein (TIGR03437 family)
MRCSFCLLRAALALALASPLLSQNVSVVISQIYGGGGNMNAPLRADFVEIFNRGSAAVNISGWTVQYASATGMSWDRTELAGTLQPGQYYLIQEAVGNVGAPLPAPDATGSVNLSATSGKIALVAGNSLLSGASPTDSAVMGFVGYGTANAAETSPAPSLDNVTAILRRSNGCADTNDNAEDLDRGSPAPRNSRAAVNPCASSEPQAPTISADSIVNAASFARGPIAPGEILTIFGSGLGPSVLQGAQLTSDGSAITKTLAGTRVLFSGTPGPIVYTRADQVSVIAPYSISGQSSVDIRVEYNGTASHQVTLPTAAVSPGIFTDDSSGTGQGAIQNQDYSLNGELHPAGRGSVITIYAAGGGATDRLAADGAIIDSPYPLLLEPVVVRVGGVEAEVLYAGMAPELVNGLLQINARIPESLTQGGTLPLEVRVGDAVSQMGVTVTVEDPAGEPPGTGPLIEQRLAELKSSAAVPPLPEIPNDRVKVPEDWLALVSWNTQVGGTSTSPGDLRPPMVQAALASMFSGTYQILAAQEIPNQDSADFLRSLLPGGTASWQQSFFDTTDSMDNGFWFQRSTVLREAFLLNTTNEAESGKIITDPTLAVHPPQVGQFEIDDFDFTLINVHLTFADGDTAESARELRSILDYLDWYFNQPDHDPDVVVCGDFNMPSLLSNQKGSGGITLDSVFQQDPRFQRGERRFVVTVHEPTSRSAASGGGVPVSNYDHCVVSADTLKAFIEARRVDTAILTDNPDDPESRLTSDHFPIVAFFRTRGPGIALDHKLALRPPN